jgi:ABC-type transport system involved in multi-copper enzyme maturation permease subunit
MKFLAILRDSLREAMDSSVFYVMIGLSVLMILFTLTISFTPTAGGEAVMQMASLPVALDPSDLNLAQLDPDALLRSVLKANRGIFQPVGVDTIGDQPDAPTSTFRVTLLAMPVPNAVKNPGDDGVEAEIRSRFGRLDRWHIAEVIDVRRAAPDNPHVSATVIPFAKYYEVTARPTADGTRLWPHKFSVLFGAFTFPGNGTPLGAQLWLIENYVLNGVGAWVIVLVSIVITSFFIPNMLRKGTVDFLLVKPIRRATLLMYKFIGGLAFIFLNTSFAIVGMWVALGLRSGVWATGVLFTILIITFFFAILYSVSVFFGVLTGSPIAAILLTCFSWGVLSLTGCTTEYYDFVKESGGITARNAAPPVTVAVAGLSPSPLAAGPLMAATILNPEVADRITPSRSYESWFAQSVYAVHYVLPRTRDLDEMTTHFLLRDLVVANQVGDQHIKAKPLDWTESITVSGIFIVLLLGMSCWWFATKDY